MTRKRHAVKYLKGKQVPLTDAFRKRVINFMANCDSTLEEARLRLTPDKNGKIPSKNIFHNIAHPTKQKKIGFNTLGNITNLINAYENGTPLPTVQEHTDQTPEPERLNFQPPHDEAEYTLEWRAEEKARKRELTECVILCLELINELVESDRQKALKAVAVLHEAEVL